MLHANVSPTHRPPLSRKIAQGKAETKAPAYAHVMDGCMARLAPQPEQQLRRSSLRAQD